jgi:hypothetical protein
MEGITLVETETLNQLIGEVRDMKAFVAKAAYELSESKKPYLSVTEAMQFTGFGKSWVMENKHLIGYSTVGGCLRFKRKDIEAYMEANYFKAKINRRG